jgi:uncharacterized LabA/DUF88 family protein
VLGSVLVELTILLTAVRQQTAQVLTDRAILITGDSDQVPTISLVKENFPRKHITVVVPIGRSTDELKETAHTVEKMSEVPATSPDARAGEGAQC